MSLLTLSLKQQFSRDRQVFDFSSEVVVKKRQSYGHPMSGRKLKFMKDYLAEEKEQSEESLMQLIQQAESMRVLINTTNYDYGQVKAKMDITYLIREINLRSDPFAGDIIEALKCSCTKLMKYLEHQQKEKINEEEQPFFILEYLIMKRYKHLKKLLLNYETIDAYPIIQIQTQTINNIKNDSIVIEYNILITTSSQIEAMAILIESYEIFNIEYLAKIRATLEVMNGLLFKKRSFFLSLAAKRFINEYKLNNHIS
ncbi:unnamed protein product [Rotaria sordida]|uniref:Uncharacterized protein n=1 Tax=Rotaria sordida TaxID=392033 RepID=A0A815SQ62_9BILA|nr:unnamed protein product [Rotaria sordida]